MIIIYKGEYDENRDYRAYPESILDEDRGG